MRSVSACLLLALASCTGSSPPVEERPDNLLLIVIDTLRADHLGCYGAERETSPAIDRLAASGLRFERAYATAPWTMPSVASMITGLYPIMEVAVAIYVPESPDRDPVHSRSWYNTDLAHRRVTNHWTETSRRDWVGGIVGKRVSI